MFHKTKTVRNESLSRGLGNIILEIFFKCSGKNDFLSILTCCRLGVDEIEVAIWRGVSLGDSTDEDDDELSLRKFSVLHITGETSIDDGMACDVTDAYDEYSKGFVIAMSELRISGVRGVVELKSTPTPSSGGVESDVLKLYIFQTLTVSFLKLSALLQLCLI